MNYDGTKPKPTTPKPDIKIMGRPGKTIKHYIEMENTGMKIGDKVAYIKLDGSWENGIIKSIGSYNTVFVVFNCGDEWDNYKDYTAAGCDKSQLVEGWRDCE